MQWLGAQRHVSALLIPEEAPAPASQLQAAVPNSLVPPLLPHHAIQGAVGEWLLSEVEREAREAIASPQEAGLLQETEPSACVKLLTAAMQELIVSSAIVSSIELLTAECRSS